MDKTKTIQYQEFTLLELCDFEQELIDAAMNATSSAYAPYSNFHVGAAVRLDSGEIVTGSNQENIAYPSGLCAERTALFTAATQHPDSAVLALAIVARNSDGKIVPISPCGACRQVMAEQESRQDKKMRILCYNSNDKILIFDGVESLLPFVFTM